MSEYEMIDEEIEVHGTELLYAILHVLDGRSHTSVFSDQTLDLEDEETERYVRRTVTRCMNDLRLRPGVFHADSSFANYLNLYFIRETGFTEFSKQILEKLWNCFDQEAPNSCDALVCDYREDDVPYIGVYLLEQVPAVTLISDVNESGTRNRIHTGAHTMPGASKKIRSFAIVNQISHEIFCCDETKWEGGTDLLNMKLLECDSGISKKEIVDTVKEVTNDIAEEYDENPAILLSRVKNYISETVKEGEPVNTEKMAEEVFDAKPEMAKAFLNSVQKHELPKEVELSAASVSRSMRRQRIATDTGIELAFPAEYFRNHDFIEFVNHEDGTISIEIKNIGKITNK